MMRRGKFGRFIACDKYPECKKTFNLPNTGLIKNTDKVCEVCGHPMILVINKGKRPLDVCINQDCKSKTSDEEKKEIEKIEQKKIEKKCPKCGKDLILRKSVYGSFLACPGYPKCKYTESLESNDKFKKDVKKDKEEKKK
jgi:DNA topoisomerase-1